MSLRCAVVQNWRNFWFKPEPAYTLGLVRIGFGTLIVLWTLSLPYNMFDLFGRDGVMPQRPSRPYKASILDLCTNDRALLIVWAVLLLSSIAMTIGWHSRLASTLVLVLLYSFVQGYRPAFNGGDSVLCIEAFVLALSSSGAALSLDRRRSTGSFWSAQWRAPWAIRLLQVELASIYAWSAQIKLTGSKWVDGTAVSYSWRYELPFSPLPPPELVYDSTLLVNLATWGAVIAELALATLIWIRRWRPWVLAAGVCFHLVIMLSMNIGMYSLAMFSLYLAFVEPDKIKQLPDTFKRLSSSWRWLMVRPVKMMAPDVETADRHLEEAPENIRGNEIVRTTNSEVDRLSSDRTN